MKRSRARLRIARPLARQKAKAVSDASALLGRQAAVVQIFGVIPEAFGFGHGRRHKSPVEELVLARTPKLYPWNPRSALLWERDAIVSDRWRSGARPDAGDRGLASADSFCAGGHLLR